MEAGHQRQGIGTLLVQKIEGLLLEDGIRTIVADTPQQNVPARNFLEVTPITSRRTDTPRVTQKDGGLQFFFLV